MAVHCSRIIDVPFAGEYRFRLSVERMCVLAGAGGSAHNHRGLGAISPSVRMCTNALSSQTPSTKCSASDARNPSASHKTRKHKTERVLRLIRATTSLPPQIHRRSRSAAFSAIMTVAALVLEEIRRGITELSQIRNRSTPRSRNCGSTTESSLPPILQVPTGW